MNGWTFALVDTSTLFIALGVAALLTTALYLLRLKRRPQVVPFIELWQTLLLDKKAAALRSQLKRLISLLLSLLLVALLVLAFADPRSPGERRGRHLVVLIDAGLSMSRGEGRCLESAKGKVHSWFESLGSGDEMLLVEMGARPRPLDAFSSEPSQLEAALASIRPLDVRPDLGASLSLARDVLSSQSSPEIIVVSDSALQQSAPVISLGEMPPLRFVNVSDACVDSPLAEESLTKVTPNLGIDVFSARRYPLAGDRFEVLLSVFNEGDEPVDAEISIYSVDKQGARGPLVELVKRELLPDVPQVLTFSNLGRAESGLIAEIKGSDAQVEADVSDNWALAVLSQRLPVRVLVVGELDTFLEAALLIEESLIVKQIEASSYPPSEEFDVTLFNGVTSPRDPRTGGAVYLGLDEEAVAPGAVSDFPLLVDESISMFGFDTWDKKSPVFQLIDPYDIQVLSGVSFETSEGETILGRSAGRAILVAGKTDEGDYLALGFRPKKSDFVLRPAWPLFVINLIDTLHPRGRGEVLSSGEASTELRVPVADRTATTAEVTGPLLFGREPQKRTVPVVDGYAVVYSQQAGFFDVVTQGASTRVAFSPQHKSKAVSGTPVRPQGKLGGYETSEPQNMEPRPNFDPWFWLLAVVFAVSFFEWWSYHRRWTV